MSDFPALLPLADVEAVLFNGHDPLLVRTSHGQRIPATGHPPADDPGERG